MKNFHSKNWSIKELENMIVNNAEESINLDFKAAESLGKSEGKKKEIAKDVSAFANSDGGIIIYGICEINHVASEFSYVDGNEFTKEWLEQVINTGIQPKIENLIIHPVRKDGDIEKTIYIVEIPASEICPHMSKEKRYYKRYNFESEPMEEYEVSRLYLQEKKTKLEIGNKVIGVTTHKDNPHKTIGISIAFKVKNIGNTIEKNFKLQIKLPAIKLLPISCDELMSFTNSNNTHIVYSASNISPIFQDEEIIIGAVIYNFEKYDVKLLNIELEIEVTLFYSAGIERKKIKLREIYYEAINVHN